ncbi:MAG: imidazolonepropionase, partial [Candidatus Dormibacteria bacterium]
MSTLLRGVGRLFNAGTAVAERVEVLLQEGRVAAVGAEGSLRPPADVQEYDCGRGLVTAGLVDAHTHPLYARPRLEEVARRSAGESYAQLAKLGGGISATVRQTREAAWPELEAGLRLRLRAWLAQGTTTVEAKTGYWLTREGELAAVRLLASLAEDRQLPHLAVTLLGAHALPEDFRDRRADFVAEVATWSAPAASLGARFADVFCDQGAFSVDEARAVLAAAGRAGLGLRLHADELALTGGAQLGADLGACSADHLLQVGPAEIGALAQAGTVATLCPITAISLGKLPPARELSAAGVQLALGTDHN